MQNGPFNPMKRQNRSVCSSTGQQPKARGFVVIDSCEYGEKQKKKPQRKPISSATVNKKDNNNQ